MYKFVLRISVCKETRRHRSSVIIACVSSFSFSSSFISLGELRKERWDWWGQSPYNFSYYSWASTTEILNKNKKIRIDPEKSGVSPSIRLFLARIIWTCMLFLPSTTALLSLSNCSARRPWVDMCFWFVTFCGRKDRAMARFSRRSTCVCIL